LTAARHSLPAAEGDMRHSIVLIVAACLLSTAALAGDNWPQYRGPHGDGASDSTGLPLTWSEKDNVVWKTPIHDKGWSSPVVWGDRVWLTTAKADGKALYAVCVDRESGKGLHDLKVFDVEKPAFCHEKNSYASPTPVVEEGRVYVHFGTYGTACLDQKTGEKIWERTDLHCDHWRGPASSPILFGDLLFLTFDGYDVQFVVALDKANGKTVWKKDRSIDFGTTDGDRKKGYGTPRIIEVKGKPQLISPAAVATTAYDPKTGEELWKVYHGGMNVTQPPLFDGTKVYLCTGDVPTKMFAVKADGAGDVTKTHIDWSIGKNVPSRSSPLLVDDLLYFANESGQATCVEAKGGEVVWQERLGFPVWGSPVVADGRLYFIGDEGTAAVAKTGRKWKELARNKLDDGCMASPAVAGKSLFIRTKTHLYRIEKKD
jgi:outer membrane protein assembly factor BamB